MSISDWSSDFCSSDLEKPGLTNLSSASSPTQEDRNEASTKVLASPAVRARAKALGVDLSMVHSQGERIRHADLDAYLFYGKGEGYRAPGTSTVRPDEQEIGRASCRE